jgi:hypothetical protein
MSAAFLPALLLTNRPESAKLGPNARDCRHVVKFHHPSPSFGKPMRNAGLGAGDKFHSNKKLRFEMSVLSLPNCKFADNMMNVST